MGTGKNSTSSDDSKAHENLKLYALIAGALIIIAIISTIVTNVAVPAGRCGGIIQQQNYNCLEQLAYSTSNSSMCSSLPGSYGDQCYSAIAENTKNQTLCSKISDANTSGTCTIYIASQTKNPDLCSALNRNMMQVCINEIAVSLKSPATCARSVNLTGKMTCLSAVYLQNAVSHTNSSSCAMIQSNNDSGITYSSIGLLTSQSYNYVNLTQVLSYLAFSNASVGARDLCYMYLAYSTTNKAYCADVSQNMSTICNSTASHFNTISYNSTAGPSNFSAFMNLCNQQANVTQCENTAKYLQAITAKNLTDCKNLTTVYSSQCYYTLAQEYNSTKYCSYITNSTFNNECINSIKTKYNGTIN